LTSSSFAEAVESRPSITDISSSRVRIDAGNLLAMGCSFAGLPSPQLNHTLQRMHPAKFPANLELHLLPDFAVQSPFRIAAHERYSVYFSGQAHFRFFDLYQVMPFG
jgi:hypothetical protein